MPKETRGAMGSTSCSVSSRGIVREDWRILTRSFNKRWGVLVPAFCSLILALRIYALHTGMHNATWELLTFAFVHVV